MADEKRWTSTDRIESLAAEQSKADPSGQPSPDEAPPVPRDVLSVPREGLERHEGKRKKVLIIGAGMAGLVAAYELKRQGHQPRDPRGPGPRRWPGLHAPRAVRAGPVRRGRRDAHPARAQPDARVLRAVQPADAAVRHGQSQGPRLRRRPAHDGGRGERAPGEAAVRPVAERARPQRGRPVADGHRGPQAAWSTRTARRRGPRSSSATTSSRSTSSCATRASARARSSSTRS